MSTPAAAADSPLPPPPTPEPVKLNKVKSTTKKKYNLRGGRKVASTPKPKEKKIPAASVKKSSSAVAPAASAPPTPLNTTLNTSLSTSLSTSISATPGSGVLRFGENFEAFFLLADASSDDDAQRRKLGESIVSHDDPDCSSSSSAASSHTRVEEWQSLLVLTSKAVAALPAKAKKKSGRDLIKVRIDCALAFEVASRLTSPPRPTPQPPHSCTAGQPQPFPKPLTTPAMPKFGSPTRAARSCMLLRRRPA